MTPEQLTKHMDVANDAVRIIGIDDVVIEVRRWISNSGRVVYAVIYAELIENEASIVGVYHDPDDAHTRMDSLVAFEKRKAQNDLATARTPSADVLEHAI